MAGVKLGKETAKKVLQLTEQTGLHGNPFRYAPQVQGEIQPVEISSSWVQQGSGAYSCEAKRLYFPNGSDSFTVSDIVLKPVYDPMSKENKPSYAIGDRVSVRASGARWEILGGGGGGTPINPVLRYGVCETAIGTTQYGYVRLMKQDGTLGTERLLCTAPPHYSGVLLSAGMPVTVIGSQAYNLLRLDNSETENSNYITVSNCILTANVNTNLVPLNQPALANVQPASTTVPYNSVTVTKAAQSTTANTFLYLTGNGYDQQVESGVATQIAYPDLFVATQVPTANVNFHLRNAANYTTSSPILFNTFLTSKYCLTSNAAGGTTSSNPTAISRNFQYKISLNTTVTNSANEKYSLVLGEYNTLNGKRQNREPNYGAWYFRMGDVFTSNIAFQVWGKMIYDDTYLLQPISFGWYIFND